MSGQNRLESMCRALLAGLLVLAARPLAAQTPRIWVGPNVNMVSGTVWPDGDPFLQRQNEPSIAVSTRNALNLLAGANDYRTVDLPGLPEGKETGDAWLGVFRSTDGGGSWKSTLVRGYPQDQTLGSPLHGYEAAADPVVRAGTHGLFYYSGIVFDRSLLRSATFVQRFMDLNNETLEPIRYIDTVLVDSFDAGEAFIDKPWLEVDIPRTGALPVTLEVPQGSGTVSQTVPCGNVYMAWAEITGQGAALRTRIMFSRSTDCGGTWSTPIPLSPSDANSVGLTVAQGATIAVAPSSGRVSVAWRQFRSAAPSCTQEKGFWKNSPGVWPVETLVVGGVTYTKQQAIVILSKTYPPSDAPGILAQQLIAAKLNVSPLNVYSGADNVAIEQVIAAADAWLVAHPLGSKPSPAEKQAGLALKNQLEAFNKGLAGTAACSIALTPYADAILVAHSDDGGQTFTAPTQVATVSPFDQGTSEYSFRTNAYPTMAVDQTGRAYLAWATRGLATPHGDPVAGDARIVITISHDGTTWTTPQPIDQPALPGHQLFPALTYNTGKLLLVYNDYRADASGVFERFIVDLLDATHPMRHTVDVRAAIADPADVPVFTNYTLLPPIRPSDQVSRYPFIVTGTSASDAASLQLQYNPPNLPMFELGHKPFFGDYHDVAGAPRFVPDSSGAWVYNTAPLTAPVYHAVWTDNRDVVGPPDGNWENYVAPGPEHTSPFNGSTVPDCEQVTGGADRTQMRNQNIYTARLATGLYVAVPSNSRPLSDSFQRAFVIFAQNATDTARQFRLQILNQPAGGTASFAQFSAAATIDVTITAYSSISQPVFVTSSEPAASVDVQVTELGACSGTNTCLQSTVRINPDPSNPPPADASLLTGETYNPAVFNPAVYNPAVYNPAVFNPGVFNPAVFNPAVFNPAVFNDSVINYDPLNPAVFNPAVLNPAVFNPAVFNPAVFNNAVISQALLNPAVFNPAVLNPAVLNPAVFNPAVFNPAVLNPAVLNPAVFNPAVFNPAVLNPAVFNPAVFNTVLSDGSVTEANFKVENAGNTTAAYSLNLNLANAPSGFSYQLMIYRLYFTPVANGCQLTEAAQQELLVNTLSPNLSAGLLDPNGGASFSLNPGDVAIATLRITPDPDAADPGDPSQINLGDLSVSVVSKGVNTEDAALGDTQPPVAQILAPSLPPLVISTTTLPDSFLGSPYSATLTATGGAGSRTWSSFGALPPGLTLSPTGVVAGTPTAAGAFTFTIRVTDATQFAERIFTVAVASGPAPATLTFTPQPADAIAGQVMPSVTVEARDGTNTLLPGVQVTMTLATTACAAATLTGITTMGTNASGVADFPGLIIDRGGWGYTLTASVSGNPAVNVTSNPFNVEGFCDTGSPSSYRWRSSVTKLADGRVLIAGGMGSGGNLLDTAEIYDPSTGVFTPTVGTMNVARNEHQGVLLPSGKVLIVGGYQSLTPPGETTTVAELFDPAGGGTFTPTSGALSTGRVLFTATWVPAAGKVLVAGGGTGVITASAEVYDPATDSFAATTGFMNTERSTHTATLLDNGNVLVVGGASNSGASLASAELWDSTTGLFTATGSLAQDRQQHGAVKLLDGRVLLLGGISYPGGGVLLSAEIYDPGTGTFSPTGSMVTGRFDVTVAPLLSGKVLAVGGQNGDWLHSAEVFDPAAGSFAPTGSSLLTPYEGQAISLLTNKVLVASYDSSQPAQLFYPKPPPTFLVTNTNDTGTGSLRQAILDANAHPGLDAIHFAIPGAGIQTISPASALPVITGPIWVDATTQPGYAGTPLIRLDGTAAGPTVNGLEVQAGNSLVQGVMVTGFVNVGIQLTNSTATRVIHNYVGTNGIAALGNGVGGIFVAGGTGNVLDGNVVSGNQGDGIALHSGAVATTVRDNRVGTNATGVAALANNNGSGISVDGAGTSGNIIANNLSSGNTFQGIDLRHAAHHNTIIGNRLGTNASGDAAVPNSANGINSWGGAHDNLIGGMASGDGNLISGNGANGITLANGTFGSSVLGNRIGTNVGGDGSLANGDSGVMLFDPGTTGNTVRNNLCSGNVNSGVYLHNGAHGNTVAGNLIGSNAQGIAIVANNSGGVMLTDGAHDNTIGGSHPADANLIVGNHQGLYLKHAATTGNIVHGNWLGTNSAMAAGLGNTWEGILIEGASNTQIGGLSPGEGNVIAFNNMGVLDRGTGNLTVGNVISANSADGVRLWDATVGIVKANRIGTDPTGDAAMGNGGAGIMVQGSASGNTIGGSTIADGNLISSNGANGITLDGNAGTVTANAVTGNRIGTNAAATAPLGNTGDGIGIYFGASGTTVADNIIGASTANGVRVNSGGTGNTIRHNWVGTNPALAAGLGNGNQGISVEASSGTIIGGSNAGDGNVVAFNTDGGILLEGGSANTLIRGNLVSGNTGPGVGVLDSQTATIAGNLIGTNVAGTAAWPNSGSGVSLSGAPTTNVIVGGTTAADRNVISGNSMYGVWILAAAHDNLVEGNLIGTGATGDVALPNLVGIVINSANNTARSNLVSGNTADGIDCGNGATGNLVEDNRIGTNDGGATPLGRQHFGIQFFGPATTANTIRGNLISNNDFGLVFLDGAHHNTVLGNRIGTDLGGTSSIANGDGVQVSLNAHDTVIGGPAPGAGNLISGNTGNGIAINGGATLTMIWGNLIGTDAGGTLPLPNSLSGISIAASNNHIGDELPSPPEANGNVVAFNGAQGIEVVSGNRNDIVSNRIWNNGGLGILLGPGANDGLSAPAITSAVDDGTFTWITGSVEVGDLTTTTVWLDFFVNTLCDPSGSGEGQVLLGHTLLSGPGGVFPFTVGLPSGHLGESATATAQAIDGAWRGDTSQFSACRTVVGP